jgi:hypothetical protein
MSTFEERELKSLLSNLKKIPFDLEPLPSANNNERTLVQIVGLLCRLDASAARFALAPVSAFTVCDALKMRPETALMFPDAIVARVGDIRLSSAESVAALIKALGARTERCCPFAQHVMPCDPNLLIPDRRAMYRSVEALLLHSNILAQVLPDLMLRVVSVLAVFWNVSLESVVCAFAEPFTDGRHAHAIARVMGLESGLLFSFFYQFTQLWRATAVPNMDDETALATAKTVFTWIADQYADLGPHRQFSSVVPATAAAAAAAAAPEHVPPPSVATAVPTTAPAPTSPIIAAAPPRHVHPRQQKAKNVANREMSQITCNRCGGFGHLERVCTRSVNIKNQQRR